MNKKGKYLWGYVHIYHLRPTFQYWVAEGEEGRWYEPNRGSHNILEGCSKLPLIFKTLPSQWILKIRTGSSFIRTFYEVWILWLVLIGLSISISDSNNQVLLMTIYTWGLFMLRGKAEDWILVLSMNHWGHGYPWFSQPPPRCLSPRHGKHIIR